MSVLVMLHTHIPHAYGHSLSSQTSLSTSSALLTTKKLFMHQSFESNREKHHYTLSGEGIYITRGMGHRSVAVNNP